MAIGRAIVREPQVFLFDEPLSNLDAELRVQMRLEIAKLHKELGVTMIYVTHDQVEAMTLADKIVVLRAGRIEQVGSPIGLYDDPDNMFVAGFIGSPRMNFVSAKVMAVNGKSVRVGLPELGGAEAEFELKSDIAQDTEIKLGIRPEHFDPAGATTFEINVDVVENLGGTAYAYSRTEGEEPMTVDLKGDRSVGDGSRLRTGFNARDAFLFEAPAGKRIR